MYYVYITCIYVIMLLYIFAQAYQTIKISSNASFPVSIHEHLWSEKIT